MNRVLTNVDSFMAKAKDAKWDSETGYMKISPPIPHEIDRPFAQIEQRAMTEMIYWHLKTWIEREEMAFLHSEFSILFKVRDNLANQTAVTRGRYPYPFKTSNPYNTKRWFDCIRGTVYVGTDMGRRIHWRPMLENRSMCMQRLGLEGQTQAVRRSKCRLFERLIRRIINDSREILSKVFNVSAIEKWINLDDPSKGEFFDDEFAVKINEVFQKNDRSLMDFIQKRYPSDGNSNASVDFKLLGISYEMRINRDSGERLWIWKAEDPNLIEPTYDSGDVRVNLGPTRSFWTRPTRIGLSVGDEFWQGRERENRLRDIGVVRYETREPYGM